MKRVLSALLALCLIVSALPAFASAADDLTVSTARQTNELSSGGKEFKKLSKEEIYHLMNGDPKKGLSTEDLFDETPSCVYPYELGKVKDSVLQEALDRLNALRRIAGVPTVELSSELCEQGQYGAVLLGGNLNHDPKHPDDMDDSFYKKGWDACQNSNIANSWDMVGAVDGFMEDWGMGNELLLGHRCWQLNPDMGVIGFGVVNNGPDMLSRSSTVEMSHDRSGAGCDYDFISWPSSGYFPLGMFFKPSGSYWSISLNPDKYSAPNQYTINIKLVRQRDGAEWTIDNTTANKNAQSNALKVYASSHYGMPNCIIFHPSNYINDYGDSTDDSYTVTVSGIFDKAGNPTEFSYTVNFFNLETYEPETPLPAPTPSTAPTNEFEIKDGVLVKYRGNGGSVTIPESVTAIGGDAFNGCTGLTGVVFPKGMKSIGMGAFYGCRNLASVTLPEGVTSIGNFAFAHCNSLVSFHMPNTVTSIGQQAFYSDNKLTDINLSKAITSIGKETFNTCSSLPTIRIPEGVTSIGMHAFRNCYKLNNIEIPASVTSIGNYAFDALTTSFIKPELTDVYFGGSEEQWEAIEIGTNNNPLLNATIHYNSGPAESITVGGKIVYHDAYNTATVTFINAETGDKLSPVKTAKDGTYTIEGVTPGTYNIQVIKLGYVTLSKLNCQIESDMQLPEISIMDCAGDVDGDNVIALEDLSILLRNFGNASDSITSRGADINGDGVVTLEDLTNLLRNFGHGDSNGVMIE